MALAEHDDLGAAVSCLGSRPTPGIRRGAL